MTEKRSFPVLLFLLGLALAVAPDAAAKPREDGFHKGRAIVRLALPVADRIDLYLEGQATLTDVCGDPSLTDLLNQYVVTHTVRLINKVDWVMKNRGNKTPAQAYWDYIQAVYDRFPARTARAPKDAEHIPLYPLFVIVFPETTPVLEVCAAFSANPHVEYAEPQAIIELDYVPSDGSHSQLWGIRKVESEDAWDTVTGSGTVVAVVDTGVWLTHRDLAANIWKNSAEDGGTPGFDDDSNGFIDDDQGWDFGQGDNYPMDTTSYPGGHGTHCSGTIGAVEGNSVSGTNIEGVAFNTRIMALKIFGSGGGYSDAGFSALQYAHDEGADVASNSWGSPGWTGSTRDTVLNNLVAGGMVVCFSAGNDNQDNAHHYPSSYYSAISVAASTQSDGRANFSCYGQQIDITAPGVSILSSVSGAGDASYDWYQGTSMSCPLVAGGMAMLISECNRRGVAPTVEQLRQVLRMAAADVEHTGYDPHSAWGRMDVNAMVNWPNLEDACVARITYPDFLTPVTGSSLTVTGRAQDPVNTDAFSSYTLAYASGRAWNSDTWTTINTSSTATPLAGGTLGTLDLTGLADGRYSLRLRVTNSHSQTFEDRIEFVKDSEGDGDTANAVEVFSCPASFRKDYARNLAPAGDEDWWKLELVAGEDYLFTTNNLPGKTDTDIFLYRSNGTTQVAHNDDLEAGKKDSYMTWTCDTSGTYYLRCKCWDDPTGSPPYPPEEGSYDIHISGLLKDSYESDDTFGTATPIAVTTPSNHSIVPAADVDWVSFSASAGTAYTIACSGFGSNTRLSLFDTDGSTQIGSDAAADGNGAYTISWTPSTAGTYFLRVDNNGTSDTGHYRVLVYVDTDVLFEDDFDTVGAALWTPVSGTWDINSGHFRQTDIGNEQHIASAGDMAWTGVAAEATVRIYNINNGDLANAGICVRCSSDDDTFLYGRIRALSSGNTVELARYDNATGTTLAVVPFNWNASTEYRLRLELSGDLVLLYVDGTLMCSAQDRWLDQGKLAFRSFSGRSYYDDVSVFRYTSATVTGFAVTTDSLPNGEGGVAYSQAMAATGGTSPYTYTQIGGNLPPGLSLAADGTVSGTPTTLGLYTVWVRVDDSGDRIRGKAVTIDVVDTTDPVIAINAPTSGQEFGTASQTLDVDITDFSSLSAAEFQVNGGGWAALTPGTGDNYTASLTLAAGSNTVDVRATDDQTNTAADQITVDYDDTPPDVAITSPADASWVFTLNATISGTSDDAVTVSVNGVAATVDGGTGNWTADVPLVYGANVIMATATDSFARTTDSTTITIHHQMMGDVDGDGDIDEDDALLCIQHEATTGPLTGVQAAVADVDANGVIDVRDAYAIRRRAAGITQWQE